MDQVTLNPACASFTGSIMRQIGLELLRQNPANLPCAPCPAQNPDWRVSWASCVRVITLPNNQIQAVTCAGATGACIDLYHICCDPKTGAMNITWVGYSPTTDCTDVACTPVCPPAM